MKVMAWVMACVIPPAARIPGASVPSSHVISKSNAIRGVQTAKVEPSIKDVVSKITLHISSWWLLGPKATCDMRI